MVNPQDCVFRILRDDPESVDQLYDLLIWVRAAKGAQANAELDDVLRTVYARTEESIKHQESYDKRRLGITQRKPITIEASLAA